jgi:hypothetical protein
MRRFDMARPARMVLAAGAVIAAIVAASPAAQAATGCGSRAQSTPFAKYGDTNSYFLAPLGNFEAGTGGWTLSNASVVAGNETFFVGGKTTDKSSLKIGGSASTGTFCITKDDPSVRFAAKSVPSGSGGNYSQLNVSAIIRSPGGSVMTYYLGALQASGYANWTLTPQLSWGSAFADYLFGPDGTATIQFQFNVQGQGGNWLIDDVYVDPFAGR